MYPLLDPLTIVPGIQPVVHVPWYLPLCMMRGGRANPAALTYVTMVVRFGFLCDCFWNWHTFFIPTTFLFFTACSVPCSSTFQICSGLLMPSWPITSVNLWNYSITTSCDDAFAWRFDKFVAPFTLSFGNRFKRKPNQLRPAVPRASLKPTILFSSAKSKAICFTSEGSKGNPKYENSSIISTSSAVRKMFFIHLQLPGSVLK